MEWKFIIIGSICVIGAVVIIAAWEITKSKKNIKMWEKSNKRKLEDYLKEMNDKKKPVQIWAGSFI